jgi:hypothetical protein
VSVTITERRLTPTDRRTLTVTGMRRVGLLFILLPLTGLLAGCDGPAWGPALRVRAQRPADSAA